MKNHPFARFWSQDDSVCEICGIEFPDRIPQSEMFSPADEHQDYSSLVVHTGCGILRGMEFA
jgi:hypothetical protein